MWFSITAQAQNNGINMCNFYIRRKVQVSENDDINYALLIKDKSRREEML